MTMGRRSHKPDPTSRRQVEAMTAYGVPEADIARVIGIDPKTLRKHYRQELDVGATKANSRIAESLYRKALGDGPQSVTAAIFWLKTRAGWKETVVQETEVCYVARVPAPVEAVDEWLRLYSPKTIEH
jgi:hypothetical protein